MIKDMLLNDDGFPVYPWCVEPLVGRFLPAFATASDICAITLTQTIIAMGK